MAGRGGRKGMGDAVRTRRHVQLTPTDEEGGRASDERRRGGYGRWKKISVLVVI